MSTAYFRSSRKKSAGFTVLELVVVMAIMTVITSLILARHAQFNGTVLLRSLAYDVALSIREAQVYGISGKATGSFVGIQYGVYYSSASPTSYVIFADTNNGGSYSSGVDTTLEVYQMRGGYSISDFCAVLSSGATRCKSAGQIDSMTIMFKRPDPDARISTSIAGESYVEARITVASPTATRLVTVTSTGQISVAQSQQ